MPEAWTEGAWAGSEERKAGEAWGREGPQHRGAVETDWMRLEGMEFPGGIP